jgi:hypothetical protein
MSSSLRIVVLGYIVRGPIGGLVWHHLQYVMGLAQLGHDVYFLEDSDDYPSCYDPQRQTTDRNPEYGLRFAAQAFAQVGLGERWAYYDAHTARWLGPCATHAVDICRSADLLLNLSGVNPLRPWFLQVPHRVLVDTDPVFTQVRHLTDSASRATALQHTAFFSFGENIRSDAGHIPDDQLDWLPTRQPVVLDAWPVTPGPRNGKFTTVMQWDSYQPRTYDGVEYGMKSASFRPYVDLPGSTGQALELALGSDAAPRRQLLEAGWSLRNPLEVTRDPSSYQRYLQQSKAEFSVAKHGYVVSHSGWFSERSACYLASGRPVLVQETGFSEWLESGVGVVAFSTPEEALAGIDLINGDYENHSRRARELVRASFDAGDVLASLIRRVFSSSQKYDRRGASD